MESLEGDADVNPGTTHCDVGTMTNNEDDSETNFEEGEHAASNPAIIFPSTPIPQPETQTIAYPQQRQHGYLHNDDQVVPDVIFTESAGSSSHRTHWRLPLPSCDDHVVPEAPWVSP